MRIICKRKDYYDCGQAVDQDRSILYIRTENEINNIQYPFPSASGYNYSWGLNYKLANTKLFTFRELVIGFCGKIYPCIRMNDFVYCYSIRDIEEYLKGNLKEKEFLFFKYGRDGRPNKKDNQSLYSSFVRYFDLMAAQKEAHKNLFEVNKSPIFVYEKRDYTNCDLTINPLLNQYEFYRVLDPYQAYQELFIYMSNKAQPEKPIPKIDNEDKIQAAGFNKYSFRKDPSK